MDYTHLKPLIYRDREKLEDFGVYEENNINAVLYENLKRTETLNPRYKGVFPEILSLFNDAYFHLTVVFMVERPMDVYPDIVYNMTWVKTDYEIDEFERELFSQAMLYTLLSSFGNKLTTQQKELYRTLYYELYDYDGDKKTKKILKELLDYCDCISKSKDNTYNIPITDYTPCSFQEVLDSGNSLCLCLHEGYNVRDIINTYCDSKEQKIQFIVRMLESEDQNYGKDLKNVCEAYRCLHELKSELTGEPMPEEYIQDFSDIEDNDHNDEEPGSEQDDEDYDFNFEIDDDEEECDDESDMVQEYDTTYDYIFDPRVNPEVVKKALDGITLFNKQQRPFWFVFMKVLVHLQWIPTSTLTKDVLKWASLQYNLNWTTAKQLSFSDIGGDKSDMNRELNEGKQKKIKDTDITLWNTISKTEFRDIEKYRQFALLLKKTFVHFIFDGLERKEVTDFNLGISRDRTKFMKSPNKIINWGR